MQLAQGHTAVVMENVCPECLQIGSLLQHPSASSFDPWFKAQLGENFPFPGLWPPEAWTTLPFIRSA